METVIVTRHQGFVQWLKQHGVEGQVMAQVNSDDVRGKHVIGVLPLHLAAEAARITTVDMPRLRAAQRGQDLSPEEMDEAGATMSSYRVTRVDY